VERGAMALDPSSFNNGVVHPADVAGLAGDDGLPIFNVEQVQLQFSLAADFVAAQVANNVLVIALSNGRILRIDLNRPEDIDGTVRFAATSLGNHADYRSVDIDLPKKTTEVGVIRRMFLDPTASHLIICTSLAENYYLHSQSKQPRPLAKLRGVTLESVAWSPALPTSSTREILVGASDGNIYETYIETSNEFYKKEDKYLKVLQRLSDGPITGLWVDGLPGRPDVRRVIASTPGRLLHWVGRFGKAHHEGGASIYTKLFDSEQPAVHELPKSTPGAPSSLVVSPDPEAGKPYDGVSPDRVFAWLSAQGIYHGRLLVTPPGPELGSKVFSESRLLSRATLANTKSPARSSRSPGVVEAIALTQWHVLSLMEGRVVAANRLTGDVVYDQVILETGQKAVGLCVDLQKNTFWLFTAREVFEIVVRDEDRDIWKIMLKMQQFDAALQYAHTPAQKDAVAIASGDYLMNKSLFTEAAGVYGKSSKPFEEVSLGFIDRDQHDALRKYLLTKLSTFKKSAIMQRVMIASWLVEVFMAKLNSLDDTIMTKAELSETLDPAQTKEQLSAVKGEYQDFVSKYKADLDRKTVYDVISSHGREEELLYFASAVNDYNYVLSYWVQRERWVEALAVLKKQTDSSVFYRYSSVLMTHAATELVEILMRHTKLDPRSLIPALLEYDRNFSGPMQQNQAVRYLLYVVNQLNSMDAAVHNTLVSMYASQKTKDESGLLEYLESQGDEPKYDQDFALRLCIQNHRVLSCVHIYTSMGQYLQAVDLALSHDEIELASIIADRPMQNKALRKKLWLAVARKVIAQSNSIKTAIEFLKRCDLLKIEDLIPFFPDFVVIDDFKEEICTALEDYSRNIEGLKKEMDDSSQTAANIKVDIAALDHRYAIVEPGEKCYVCGLPLLSRQFFVFPCQHAFHSDCLGRKVLEQSNIGVSRRIKELQVQISKGLVSGSKKDAMVAELDALVASAWWVIGFSKDICGDILTSSSIFCSEFAIKRIDEPFVTEQDDQAEWAV
jgi:vacuolar protein sorting-associated protein 18